MTPLLWPVSLIALNFFVMDNLGWRALTFLEKRFVPAVLCCITTCFMQQLLGQTEAFFGEYLSGTLAKQVATLTSGVESILTSVATVFLRNASFILIAVVTAYTVNPIFCLILLVWVLLFASVSFKMSQHFIILSGKQAKAEAAVSGEMVDTLSNQSNIRLFSRYTYEQGRLQTYLGTQQHAHQRTLLYKLIMQVVQGTLIGLMIAVSGYFLVQLYAQSLVSIGDFVLIFGLVLEGSFIVWMSMQQVDAFNREDRTLSAKPERAPPPHHDSRQGECASPCSQKRSHRYPEHGFLL